MKQKKDIFISFHTAGGVGKSFCASLICQWANYTNKTYIGIDIDEHSQSISGYMGLNIIQVNSFKDDGTVDLEMFDKFCIYLMEKTEMMDYIIVDLGPTELLPFVSWARDSAIFDVILKETFNTHFLVPIVSDRMDDTINSLMYLINNLSININIVPIRLEYYGKDCCLEDQEAFKYLKKYIKDILYLPKISKLEKLTINKVRLLKLTPQETSDNLDKINHLRFNRILDKYFNAFDNYFNKKEHYG